MIREVAWRLLLFALPFGLYSFYLFLIRWRPGHAPPRTPWATLFIVGLSLFSASFVVWRFSEAPQTQGIYIPPHVQDGQVVPGHVEKGP